MKYQLWHQPHETATHDGRRWLSYTEVRYFDSLAAAVAAAEVGDWIMGDDGRAGRVES